MLHKIVGGQHGSLIQFLQGRQVSATTHQKIDITEDDQGENAGKDFECGEYRVTTEGKLLRKVRKKRRRVVKEEVDLSEVLDNVEAASAPESDNADELLAFPRERSSTNWREFASSKVPEPAPVPVIAAPPRALHVNKNFKNALIVMPPIDTWAPIQAIRAKYDPAFVRWMPHINMVWPFVTPASHKKCAAALSSALCNFEPFEVTFNEFGVFQKPRGPHVLYLKPETAVSRGLHELQKIMHESVPDCATDESKFVPHLTVGKIAPHMVEKVKSEAKWKPFKFTVSEVHIISRPDDETPFAVKETIQLGPAW